MQPTGGIRPDLQAFFWLRAFPALEVLSRPAHQRLTQTVSPRRQASVGQVGRGIAQALRGRRHIVMVEPEVGKGRVATDGRGRVLTSASSRHAALAALAPRAADAPPLGGYRLRHVESINPVLRGS